MSSPSEVQQDFYGLIQGSGSSSVAVQFHPSRGTTPVHSALKKLIMLHVGSEIYSRTQPTSTDLGMITSVEREIDAFRELEVDWDAEGSLPLSEETISLAKELLRQIARRSWETGTPWSNPAVAPGGNGEIEFSWEVHGRWSVLIIHPGQNEVECVTKDAGSAPRQQMVSLEDAVETALWALNNV